MASKGVIFLYNKDKKLSLLCSKGVSLKEKYYCSKKLMLKLKRHNNTHLVFKEKSKILSKEIRENLSSEKIKLVIPLFHKEKFIEKTKNKQTIWIGENTYANGALNDIKKQIAIIKVAKNQFNNLSIKLNQ